jgi:hypothetical protein
MDENAFKILDLISEKKQIPLNSTISESLGLGWKEFLNQIKCLEENEYIDEVGVNEFKISKIGLIKIKELRDLKAENDKEKTFATIFNNDFTGSTISQVNQSSNFSNSPQTNSIIANNKKPLNRSFMMNFWKLISENKLISSIVFIIILYFVKIIFGIDL